MNEKRAQELHSIIEQLQSPIPADKVADVTYAAAVRIRELWMELEAREADLKHLRQLQASQRPTPVSQSGETNRNKIVRGAAMDEQVTLQTIAQLLERLTEEVDGLKAEITNCTSGLMELESRVRDVEVGVDRLESGVERLEARVDRLDAHVERLEIRTRERRQSRSDDDHER
jgi:chromosome segregation ATPase